MPVIKWNFRHCGILRGSLHRYGIFVGSGVWLLCEDQRHAFVSRHDFAQEFLDQPGCDCQAEMTSKILSRCARGGTSVEFALVFPIFLVLAAGCMEYCRVLWMTQSLNAVAFSTARCATYGTGVSSGTNCANSAATQSYAVALAARYGITIISSGVTSASNQTCRGNTGSVKVVVQMTFNSPFAGMLNTFPATLSGTGCFKS